LSFHKQEFHETKRERKYYEKRKQKVINFITQLQDEYANRPDLFKRIPTDTKVTIRNDLERIKEKVFDI